MPQQLSIDDIEPNRFHRLLTVRSSGGAFVDGYVLSIIGIAMPSFVPALGLTEFWEGMIAVAALIGIFFGGLLGGALTDKYGRKLAYFIGPAIFTVCSLLHFFADSAYLIFLLRFLIGLGVGIEYPVATAFLVEFLPKKIRGPRLAGLTIYWFMGAATAYVVGQLILSSLGHDGWKSVLASTAFFSAILLLIRMGTPESPRWLISKGRDQEALSVVRSVFGNECTLKNLSEHRHQGERLSLLTALRLGYAKRMIFVYTFTTCTIIPVYAVYAFAPKVLEALNLRGSWNAYGSISITLLFVLGSIGATALVNVMGRRKLLIWSLFLSGCALLLLGYYASGAAGLILFLFGAYAFLSGGAQVLQWVYPNEIFPTEIRTSVVGLGTSISRIGAIIGTYLVPMAIQSIGIGNVMTVAACITFIGFIVSWRLAPETVGISLSEAASLEGDLKPTASDIGRVSN
jgi:putative MFS transporter